VSGHGLDDRAVEVLSQQRQRIFLYPLCPDRLWGPPSLLYNGYRRSFPRGWSAAEAWRWPLTPSSAEVVNEYELYLLSPQASSWRVAGLLYFTFFHLLHEQVVVNELHTYKCLNTRIPCTCSTCLPPVAVASLCQALGILVAANAARGCVCQNKSGLAEPATCLVTSLVGAWSHTSNAQTLIFAVFLRTSSLNPNNFVFGRHLFRILPELTDILTGGSWFFSVPFWWISRYVTIGLFQFHSYSTSNLIISFDAVLVKSCSWNNVVK
jgi:hypothetical protein